jgi:hypothetical protein
LQGGRSRELVVRPSGEGTAQVLEGYDRNIFSSHAVLDVINYIHANPIRRGLCESPLDWEWTGARFYEGRLDANLKMDPIPERLRE